KVRIPVWEGGQSRSVCEGPGSRLCAAVRGGIYTEEAAGRGSLVHRPVSTLSQASAYRISDCYLRSHKTAHRNLRGSGGYYGQWPQGCQDRTHPVLRPGHGREAVTRDY